MKTRKLLAVLMFAATMATGAWAQDYGPNNGPNGETAGGDGPQPDVARISLIHGDVSMQRGDTGDWAATSINAPLVPYTNFNNTVVLGSVVGWLVLFIPIVLLVKFLVVRYRATYGERVRRSKFYKAVTASQAYNVYRWFSPE